MELGILTKALSEGKRSRFGGSEEGGSCTGGEWGRRGSERGRGEREEKGNGSWRFLIRISRPAIIGEEKRKGKVLSVCMGLILGELGNGICVWL